MVFCGKPSKGCSHCRTRRIKCDQIEPACSQCLRAGKDCPGYRDQLTLLFRDENQTVVHKALNPKPRTSKKKATKSGKKSEDVSRSPRSGRSSTPNEREQIFTIVSQRLPPSPPPSTGIEDDGINFFLTHYACAVSRDPKTGRIDPSSTPLWKQIISGNTFCTALSSVGYAGLYNVTKAQDHMIIARDKYAIALRKVKLALESTHKTNLDGLFKVVMMLAAFEVVSGNSSEVGGWGVHLEGAAALLKMISARKQSTEIPGLRMQIQFCFSVFLKCLTNNESVAPSIMQWAEQARSLLPVRDRAAADLAVIVGQFVNLHAAFHDIGFAASEDMVKKTAAIEAELEDWKNQLPDFWRYHSTEPEEGVNFVYDDQFHIHSDQWSARVWNNYRWSRIYVNELLLVHMARVGSSSHDDEARRQKSLATISAMATDICTSVSTQLCQHKAYFSQYTVGPPISGLFMLLFPLAVAGSAIGVSDELHQFVIRVLGAIGNTMGVKQAVRMIGAIKQQRARWEAEGPLGFVGFSGFDSVASSVQVVEEMSSMSSPCLSHRPLAGSSLFGSPPGFSGGFRGVAPSAGELWGRTC
ncbi:hypothetical protein B0J14DRAFT_559481 [Halenospora varia]|nr:hypothetical protein B0J14DRAFT_559481 [Halenospora varia]